MQPHSTRLPFFPANLQDYAPWVATYGLLAPYGECQCGCGGKVNVARKSQYPDGIGKGQPGRYLASHAKHKLTLEDAFWQYLTPGEPDACWEWQGSRFSFGHGRLCHRRKLFYAHRASWELHKGSIPDGLLVLHKCDNPPCCNPNHLFLGTHADNVADKIAKGRGKPRPIQSYSTKLTTGDIAKIWLLREAGLLHREIAQRYGVSRTMIGTVLQGKYGKSLSIKLGRQDDAMPKGHPGGEATP